MPDRNGGRLTWAALLAHWVDAAKASVALPTDGDGGRYRRAVAPAIALQAVTHALAELDRLADPSERRLSIDRAELLVRQSAAELNEIWRGEPLPASVEAIIADARAALAAATGGGIEWTVAGEIYVAPHPGELAVTLAASGFAGDLWVPAPGIPLFRGCVVAFIAGPAGEEPPHEVVALVDAFLRTGDGEIADPEEAPEFRQAYREFDFAAGGPKRDVVAPFARVLPAGQPLLVAALLAGEAQPVSLPPRGPQLAQPLPVTFIDGPE